MNHVQKIQQKNNSKPLRGSKPFSRKIHLPTGIWSYKIARNSVIIKNPDCTKTHEACLTKITGMDWYNIERDTWKRNFSVIPSQVKTYIEENYEN